MLKSTKLFGGLFLFILALNSQAEIYKWTDSEGRVHFSDQRPQQDTESVELPAGNFMASPSRDLPENTTRNIRSSVLSGEPPADSDKEKKCLWARQNFNALYEQRPVYRTTDGRYRNLWGLDAYKGPREYIEEDERPALLEEAANSVYEHCEDPVDPDKYLKAVEDQAKEEQCDRLLAVIQDRQRPGSRVSKESIEEQIDEYRDYCGDYAKI